MWFDPGVTFPPLERVKRPSFDSSQSIPFPLIAIFGPTGSGKSELALCLGEVIGGEIVSFDSVQVYRSLDIGSAKVPAASRRGIPHHLIDVLDPHEEMTAGAYANLARASLREIRDRGSVPILAGGTGFYLRALLDGLSPAPPRDEKLRTRLTGAHRRPGALHRFLARRDPVSASRIHPNDGQKLIRAIELSVLGTQPASGIQGQPRQALPGFTCLKVGLNPDRARLYAQLNERTTYMFTTGILEETRNLLAAGVPAHSKPLQTLGYAQAVKVLTEHMPIEAAILECQTRTRQYAKRQMTWFRSEQDVFWLSGFGHDSGVQRQALDRVADFLTFF